MAYSIKAQNYQFISETLLSLGVVPVAQLLIINIPILQKTRLIIFCAFYVQGKKIYQEKLFTHFQLSDHIPIINFYRQLKGLLNLEYLYSLTKGFYGLSGQKKPTKGWGQKYNRLLNLFMGMRKKNTIGIKRGNKVMQMAAMADNLKKTSKIYSKIDKK